MFKAVLLDLDGTVYKGNEMIPGAAEAVRKMRELGARVFFLTNASTSSRAKRAEKLRSLGLDAHEADIFTSSYAAAEYVHGNLPGKRVFAICEGGVQDEMGGKGIEIADDESADVVVVGLDRHINYHKLATAYRAIAKGAAFIATNEDATYPVEDGFLPGAGAMVEAVRKSTGKNPIVMGKPNTYMIGMVMKENGLKRADAIIVGDRLETDIAAGKNAGIKTALVLTGVSTAEDVKKLGKKGRPDYVLRTLGDILSLP